jgi:hypothetical protein
MRKWTCFVAGLILVTVGRPSLGQALTFGSGSGSYTVLNGDNLALVVGQFGDLGAPQNPTTPTKPGGVLDSSGQPYFNANGSVDSLSGTNAYAALFNQTSTAGDSIQAALQAKTEYISLGNRNTVEGYSIHIDGGAAFTPFNDLSTPSVSVSSDSTTGLLTMTTTSTLTKGASSLQVSQEILFNDPGRKDIAQFNVTFTNTGTSEITGLQYARTVDPNQDVAAPGSGSVNTVQSFGTKADPTAFAINSLGASSLREMALGVQYTDPNSPGSTIYAVDGSQTEGAILTNPSYLNGQAGTNYIQLHTSDEGADYVNGFNPASSGTTSNYLDYLADPSSAPFINAADMITNPDFSAYMTDTSLVLLSPVLPDLAPGQSTTYTFYYIFGNEAPETVPEPGAVSMLFAPLVLCGCASLCKRTRPARKRRSVRS